MSNLIQIRSTLWVRAFFAYLLVLVFATHVPGKGIPHDMTYADKFLHLVGYTGLSLLFCIGFRPAAGRGELAFFLRAWLLMTGLGAIDELTQIPVPGRQAELLDWIADGIGLALGMIVFAYASRFKRADYACPTTMTGTS